MMKRNLVVIGLAVLLSACGFQLRGTGSAEFAVKEIDLQARNAYSDTAKQLRQLLDAHADRLLEIAVVITGPDLERGVLPADEAFPDDLVRMGASESEVGALVRWTVDGAPRVYALTPSAAS